VAIRRTTLSDRRDAIETLKVAEDRVQFSLPRELAAS
jgi:hypothetical protein